MVFDIEYYEYDEGHGFAKKANDLLFRKRLFSFIKKHSSNRIRERYPYIL